MTASPVYRSVGAVLGSQFDISGTTASIIGLVGSILVAIINNWSQSRRENRARRDAPGTVSSPGINFFALVMLVASVIGLVYFYNKANKSNKVDSATARSDVTTLAPEPTVAPSSADPPTVPIPATTPAAVDHLCWASTVQLAARPVDDPNTALFISQSSAIEQALPQLGQLHDSISSTPVCNSGHVHLYYFGPFDSVDTAAEMCSAIGQVLHDKAAVSYSQFVNAKGEVQYPFYFTNYGKKALTAEGNLLLCQPPPP